MVLVMLLARKVHMSICIELCTSVSYAERMHVPMLRGRDGGQHDENETRRVTVTASAIQTAVDRATATRVCPTMEDSKQGTVKRSSAAGLGHHSNNHASLQTKQHRRIRPHAALFRF